MSVKKNLAILAVVALLAGNASAFAASTVVEGPGFKYEKKNGLFGLGGKTTYTDILGNQVQTKKGIFGGQHQDTTIMGSPIMQNNNINVMAPNGQPVVTQKKTLFGGQQTKVDVNPLIQGIMNRLNGISLPTMPSSP